MSSHAELRPNLDPYRQFYPGKQVDFTLHSSNGGAFEQQDQSITVASVVGGGFFGKVILPEEGDFVVKTSTPDPWHHFWRMANWSFRDLPASYDEREAQLQHLSGKIINSAIPVISQGKFYAPANLGYAKLENGYAQVVERVSGRLPRYDLQTDDYENYKQAQAELLELGTKLGIEHVGQIHPDNPYGLPNLWFNEKKGQWVWVDTMPAIPLRGWVLPGFRYGFHGDMKNRFRSESPFNRIHTDEFATELYKHESLFTAQQFGELEQNLYHYQETANNRQLDTHRRSRQIKGASKALGHSAVSVITDRAAVKMVTSADFRAEKIEETRRWLADPKYRARKFRETIVFRGVDQARKNGIVNDAEANIIWENTEQEAKKHRKKHLVLGVLQGFYVLNNRVFDAASISVAAGGSFLLRDKFAAIAAGIVLDFFVPPIVRSGVTLGFGAVTKVDVKRAAAITLLPIPIVGSFLAIPAQLAKADSDGASTRWHYNVRYIIAKLSKLVPSGGYGTDAEAKLWKKVGKKLEKIGKHKSLDNVSKTLTFPSPVESHPQDLKH